MRTLFTALAIAVFVIGASTACAGHSGSGAGGATKQVGCHHSSGKPTIQRGSTGDAVRQAQCLLGVTVDGAFGPETEEAVVSVQAEHGLLTDGIVGPDTWAVLDPP